LQSTLNTLIFASSKGGKPIPDFEKKMKRTAQLSGFLLLLALLGACACGRQGPISKAATRQLWHTVSLSAKIASHTETPAPEAGTVSTIEAKQQAEQLNRKP
jgi:hypothetical protein